MCSWPGGFGALGADWVDQYEGNDMGSVGHRKEDSRRAGALEVLMRRNVGRRVLLVVELLNFWFLSHRVSEWVPIVS